MGSLVTASHALLSEHPGAVVCTTTRGAFTRAWLRTKTEELEAALGSEPGATIVALALPNGPLLLAAFLATLRRGRVALLLDAALPAGTRTAVAVRMHAGVVVTAATPDQALVTPLARPDVPCPPLPPGTAVLKLSSGTTSAPRGIAVSEAALLADAGVLFRTMGLRPGDRALAVVPMSFSYGLSSLLVPALTAGLELVLPDDDGPFAALRAAERHAATFFPAVPALLGSMHKLAHVELPRSLRLVISAGAALSPAAASAFRARFGTPVHAFYGASECGGICFDPTGEAALRGTVGVPIPGVELGLAPTDGLVSVVSPAVATSYWPTPDPALANGRFVASDCGRLENGELRLLGRHCESINVDGRKVHPQEVENVLVAMPGVDDVAVVRASGGLREGEACWALIACEAGTVTRSQVLEWCRRELPAYMIPRRVTLLPKLPRNARGKLDRDAVTRLAGGADA